MPTKIATALFKGGVGKTTVAINAGHAASELLRLQDPTARVLIIDADTQAGATTLLTGRVFTENDATISTVLTGQHTLAEAIISLDNPSSGLDEEGQAAYAGIDFIPASPHGKVRVGGPEEFWQLRDLLTDLGLPYGLILLDCGYGDSDLTTLALVAADHVLAVTTPTTLGLNGVRQLMDKVAAMRRSFSHMRISGVVANDVAQQEVADKDSMVDLQKQLGDLLWEPPIPRRAIVKRSHTAGLPVTVFKVQAARDLVPRYTELARRMLTLQEEPS